MTTTVERTTAANDAAPVRKKKTKKFSPWGVVAWLVGLGFFFPVLWMVLDGIQAGERRGDQPADVLLHADAGSVSRRSSIRASGLRC